MTTIWRLQQIAWDWGVRSFGHNHMADTKVRALRLLEEAIEAAQAAGVDDVMCHRQVEAVYEREHGELYQELGGVMVTAGVLALQQFGIDGDLEEVMHRELRRVLKLTPEHFAERNKQKLKLGLTG